MIDVLIAPQVEVLDLETDQLGTPSWVHPTLVWDEKEAVLIDSGYPGLLERLLAELEKAGVSPGQLTQLILTHQDIDHIGGANALLALNDRIEVLAHEQDRPYIVGERPLIKFSPERLAQITELVSSLPEERRQAILEGFRHPNPRIDRTLADGERLPDCGGIVVIHTPGHTPGHVMLYLESSRVLVAGDGLNISEGRLVGPNSQMTPDLGQATRSLKKLAGYEIETVVCYHGGVYAGRDIGARIAELANEPAPVG
jgi:glyoxylase-like metal-dependent hydrolase (beta-lactamase superfamily II)